MIKLTGRPTQWDLPAVLPAEVEDRILAEVRRRIALGTAGRPNVRILPWRRPVILSLALVVCALVMVGLVTRQPNATGQVVAGPSAVPTFEELAAVARAQPASVLDTEHPYLHLIVDRIPDEAQRAQNMVSSRHEQWTSADGAGRLRTGSLSDEQVTEESDQVEGAGSMKVAGLLPREIAMLPAEPDALLTVLTRALEHRPGEAFRPDRIALLLAVPLVPPAVREAAVIALERTGFVPQGFRTDPLGREGVLFVVDQENGDRVEVLLDPLTARTLVISTWGPTVSTHDAATTVYRTAEVSARMPDSA